MRQRSGVCIEAPEYNEVRFHTGFYLAITECLMAIEDEVKKRVGRSYWRYQYTLSDIPWVVR